MSIICLWKQFGNVANLCCLTITGFKALDCLGKDEENDSPWL